MADTPPRISEYQIASGIARRESTLGALNISVVSVKLYRLTALDDIGLSSVKIPGTKDVRVPNDIDDSDFTNTDIRSMLNAGKTPQEILNVMKQAETTITLVSSDVSVGTATANEQVGNSANPVVLNTVSTPVSGVQTVTAKVIANPLGWQQSVKKQYANTVFQYVKQLKDLYTTKLKEAFAALQVAPQVSFQTAPTPTAPTVTSGVPPTTSPFVTWNITPYCKLNSIGGDMEFNNQASVDISLVEFRRVNGASAPLPLTPRENDVLEVVLSVPNATGQYESRQFFTGLVTGISFGKEYGQLTNISLVAYGLSKMLTINKMVTDRAIISQFEGGALAEVGITVWSNYFANYTVDMIFQFLLTNEMAMRITPDSFEQIKDEFTRYSLEKTDAISTQTRMKAAIETRTKNMKISGNEGANDIEVVERELKRKQSFMGSDTMTAIEFAQNAGQTDDEFIPLGIGPTEDSTTWIATASLNLSTDSQRQLAEELLFKAKVDARIGKISDEIVRLRNAPPEVQQDKYQYNMEFDRRAFTDPTVFQLINVPLLTMALFKSRFGAGDDRRIAGKFSGRKAVAFDLLLRDSFNLFFSQLQTPATLLDEVRKVAKFQVYENERNQIVAELPRYNEFIADEKNGEEIRDFIITNPLGKIEVVKQDMNLVTRYDVKQFMPMVGYQPYTMTARQYTDPAVLAKYGMRADAPKQNPNAINEQTAALFAALEVTANNAQTRTISLSHAADRQFKLGRLYFIAIDDLDKTMGGPRGAMECDGYVGYLTGFNLTADYGNVFTYNLNFTYVRKAKLLVQTEPIREIAKAMDGSNSVTIQSVTSGAMVANFRILPDLGALIDALEKARASGEAPPGNESSGVAAIENGADLVRDEESNFVYVAKNAAWPTQSLEQPPRLYDAHDIIEVTGKYSTNKMAPLYSRQKFMQPDTTGKSTYRTLNGDLVQAVPIMMHSDVGPGYGNITQGMAHSLNVLDLRMRGMGAYLLDNMQQRVSNESRYVAANKVVERNGPWKAMYIPTFDINPWFHWMELTTNFGENRWTPENGVRMDFFIPTAASGNTYRQMGGITKFVWGNAGNPIRIKFIGHPVLTNDDKQHFCVMMFDDSAWTQSQASIWDFIKNWSNKGADLVPSEKIGLAGTGADTSVNAHATAFYGNPNGVINGRLFNTVEVLDGIDTMKADIAPIVASAADRTRIRAEIDMAAASMKANFGGETRHLFLPALIQGPVSREVAVFNAFSGYPLTLMDTGSITSVYFTGNLPAPTGATKTDTEAHVHGRALDVSLVPFYANTGLYLDDIGASHPCAGRTNEPNLPPQSAPAVYSPAGNYTGQAAGQNVPVNGQYAFVVNGIQYTNALSVPLPIKSEPGSELAVKDIFDRTLKDKILPEHFNTSQLMGRLSPTDRSWYHVEAVQGNIKKVNVATRAVKDYVKANPVAGGHNISKTPAAQADITDAKFKEVKF